MNPAKPAKVDPGKFVRTIQDNNVTYSFGSPAIWNVVSTYCQKEGITLESIKKILMAGAPVPGGLLQRTQAILNVNAEIHTPYGATESLPIASATGKEILTETWEQTCKGKGVCVGRSLPDIEIRIIEISDNPIEVFNDSLVVPPNQIGEIIVKGPVVTRAYDNNDTENALAKIKDGNTFWHRMGDLGYIDDLGRLWFCGRKGHRVITESGPMYTICCEAIFNEHPKVFRSALVGVGSPGRQQPVIIAELHEKSANQEKLKDELLRLAQQNDLTKSIDLFLVHPGFPVDIRHNAKIFREKLSLWAADELNK
jgi:acyl-CoA synthetase (AMP-forming)/AMP-acid ligase II